MGDVKRRRLFFFLACLVFAINALAHGAQAGSTNVHASNGIEYPPLVVPDINPGRLNVRVGSGSGDEIPQLRFDVMWSAKRDEPLPAIIADPSKFTVQLHLSDGSVILPKTDGRRQSWIGISLGGVTYSLIYVFPWQRNVLEEAWVEFVLPGQRYWVELPYGFTRNPADPLPPEAKRGRPAFPSTMRALDESDRLVPWLHVDYDLGKIQHGWGLTLKLANPFDAQAEAILYRDDSKVGKSMFLWKLDTPRTTMKIRTTKGRAVEAHAMGIRLHDDGMRRSDDYSFNRYPADGRDWGTAVIKVDEKTYDCVVPSSLFKYTHGFADPGNLKRLLRPH
jgi:hypothetical protein